RRSCPTAGVCLRSQILLRDRSAEFIPRVSEASATSNSRNEFRAPIGHFFARKSPAHASEFKGEIFPFFGLLFLFRGGNSFSWGLSPTPVRLLPPLSPCHAGVLLQQEISR